MLNLVARMTVKRAYNCPGELTSTNEADNDIVGIQEKGVNALQGNPAGTTIGNRNCLKCE